MPGMNLGLGLGLSPVNGINNPFSIEMDLFANSFPSIVNFSRASVATDLVNGFLTDYAINAPRISTFNGYLSEENKTNSIRNGEAQGSTVGVIGSGGALPTNWVIEDTTTLAVTVVEAGTVNGFKYIDIRLNGTAAAGTFSLLFDSASQIAAASGNVWTGSVWVGLLSGGLTNISSTAIRVSERAAGVELAGTSTAFTPTIDPTRFMSQRVFNNAGTTHAIHQLNVVSGGGAVDVTFRIAAAQLETGYDLTSYIRTTGAAVTRSRDIAYVLSSSINYNTNEGTFVVAYNLGNAYLKSSSKTIFSASSQEDGRNCIRLLKLDYNAYHEAQVLLNYTLPVSIVFAQLTSPYSSNIVAMRYKVNDAASCRNGGTVGTDTSFPTAPTGIDSYRVYIGQGSSSFGNINGYLTGFKYSRTALPNSTLVSETA